MSDRQFYRCHVLEAGARPGEGQGRVAVNLVGLDPMKAIGWRYPESMPAEVLATALTAMSANLQVSCAFANDDATGPIVALNLVRR